MGKLNYLLLQEIIKKSDEPLSSKEILKEAQDEKPRLSYSTVKTLLKKMGKTPKSAGNGEVIRIRKNGGKGRGGIYYEYTTK